MQKIAWISVTPIFPAVSFLVLVFFIAIQPIVMSAETTKSVGRFHEVPLTGEETIETGVRKGLQPYVRPIAKAAGEIAYRSYKRAGDSWGSTWMLKPLVKNTIDQCYGEIKGQNVTPTPLQQATGRLTEDGSTFADLCHQKFKQYPWLLQEIAKAMPEQTLKQYLREGIVEGIDEGTDKLRPFHIHFFEANGGMYNVGYYPSGVKQLKAVEGTPTGETYSVEIMKKAAEVLEASNEWKPEAAGSPFGYNLRGHNCHHYAEALRKEYERIASITRVMEDIFIAQYKQQQVPMTFGGTNNLGVGGEFNKEYPESWDQLAKDIGSINASTCPDDFRLEFSKWQLLMLKWCKINAVDYRTELWEKPDDFYKNKKAAEEDMGRQWESLCKCCEKHGVDVHMVVGPAYKKAKANR